MLALSWISFFPADISAQERSTAIRTFVSIPPQAFFVQQIGGSHVTVDVLLVPGKNHDTFSPSPDQMARLAKADIFFTIGLPYERAVVKKIDDSFKNLKVVNTAEGIVLRKMEGHHTHDHGNGIHEGHPSDASPESEGEGNDPHTWLNPILVIQQAETILKCLISVDPENTSLYTANFETFKEKLKDLDSTIRTLLEPVKGGRVFVFHPAFGYFTDAYGLKQVPVEIEGKSPKAQELSHFITMAKENKVRVVFVQKYSNQNAAKKIASAVNGAVVELDPLEETYFDTLLSIAEKMASALKKE